MTAADAPARLAADAADDRPLLNMIARSINDELKLRLPTVVPYAAYGSEQAFVAALLAQGMSAERVRPSGRSIVAVAFGRSGILADGHVPAWRWEGHSEWVGHRVAGLLGLKSYVESRRNVRWFVWAKTGQAPLPPLSLKPSSPSTGSSSATARSSSATIGGTSAASPEPGPERPLTPPRT